MHNKNFQYYKLLEKIIVSEALKNASLANVRYYQESAFH